MDSKSKTGITTVDDYFAWQSEQARTALEQLRQIIKKAAPEAEEVISYQMPAFRFHGILVYYAAFKNHYSLFPKAKAIEVFRKQLKSYKTTKGTIHFPYGKKLDENLVGEIVRFNIRQNLEKQTAKKVAISVKNKKT